MCVIASQRQHLPRDHLWLLDMADMTLPTDKNINTACQLRPTQPIRTRMSGFLVDVVVTSDTGGFASIREEVKPVPNAQVELPISRKTMTNYPSKQSYPYLRE